jgi:hypothetical protein
VADGITDTERANARSVVHSWRAGDHLGEWGPSAHDKDPHWLTVVAVAAHVAVATAADDAADSLIAAGFLPGHAHVRNLRGTASTLAREANRLQRWAEALRGAAATPEEDDRAV